MSGCVHAHALKKHAFVWKASERGLPQERTALACVHPLVRAAKPGRTLALTSRARQRQHCRRLALELIHTMTTPTRTRGAPAPPRPERHTHAKHSVPRWRRRRRRRRRFKAQALALRAALWNLYRFANGRTAKASPLQRPIDLVEKGAAQPCLAVLTVRRARLASEQASESFRRTLRACRSEAALRAKTNNDSARRLPVVVVVVVVVVVSMRAPFAVVRAFARDRYLQALTIYELARAPSG